MTHLLSNVSRASPPPARASWLEALCARVCSGRGGKALAGDAERYKRMGARFRPNQGKRRAAMRRSDALQVRHGLSSVLLRGKVDFQEEKKGNKAASLVGRGKVCEWS